MQVAPAVKTSGERVVPPARRVRLLHWVGSLDIGGEQRYLIRLANRLDRSRFQQTIAFTFGDSIRHELAPHIDCVELLGHRPRATRPADWRLVATMTMLIRRFGPDVVTTHSAGVGQLAAGIGAKLCRKPVVHTIQRAYGLRSRTEDAVIRIPPLRHLAYGLVDRFVALGTYYRNDQATRWRIPADKLVLNYIGVDFQEFRPDSAARGAVRRELGFDEGAVLVGHIARHSPEKGVLRTIDGFARVHERVPHARLLLVGDGPARPLNEARARELGLERVVRFAGARYDAAAVINGCDVMVQATYHPLNGISSIEAMSVGKPILTVVDDADEESMASDTCVDGRNGVFFRTWRPEESADRVADLLRDPNRMRAMGMASREMALERFDLDQHVHGMERLYASLATGDDT